MKRKDFWLDFVATLVAFPILLAVLWVLLLIAEGAL